MTFAGINYLAVLIAAAGGFLFGSVWYGLLGKQWMAAVGMTEHPKPAPAPFIIAFVCQLVMAWVLAGIVGHFGEVTLTSTLITAALVWAGFLLTTQLVNHHSVQPTTRREMRLGDEGLRQASGLPGLVGLNLEMCRELTDEGLLVSDTPKAPVRLAFSAATSTYWLPDLISE